MQHYISDSIYGLTIAWITSENSTKQLECRHLDSIFFAGPYLMLARLSTPGVRSRLPLSVFRRQLLSAPLSNQLSSRVPLPLPDPPRFQVQNLLSGFAPKQTKESSAWRATYIVLQSKLHHCWERLEYWEESWRPEDTCGHSDSSERPPANDNNELELRGRIKSIRTTELLRSARILRRVLETWGDLLVTLTPVKDH